MKKKLYTTTTLFAHVVNIMKKENTLRDEDLLDYYLPTRTATPIKFYAFSIVGDLVYGGNEGIYLSMFVDGVINRDKGKERIHVGTFKTLRDDREALKEMSVLMADFIYNGRKFVDDNLDDFDHPIEAEKLSR